MNTCIVISTWDKGSKLWPIIQHCFDKYWKDCPYEVYFLTNTLDAPFGKTIKVGEDKGWYHMVTTALPQIPYSSFIFLIDDYWLYNKVDQETLSKLVATVETKEADYIRIVPSRGAVQYYNENLKYFNLDYQYRTSLGPSIWNKDFFLSLLREEENIWQFEMQSATRLNSTHKTLCVNRSGVFDVVCEFKGSPWKEEPVEKGKLTETAYEFLKLEGLEIK